MNRRDTLIQTIGYQIVLFQDVSDALDDAAAQVLGLERKDLKCISLLLFAGAASHSQLADRLQYGPRELKSLLSRLELAGYARRVGSTVELTEHARSWVATLWGPLEREANALLSSMPTRELQLIERFMQQVHPVHLAHAARIRALLDVPSGRRNQLKGGLSPAALRRVQLFVEANLERSIRLEQLAERAGLSPFHFARAFKTTMSTTPRAFVESRRIERAKQLLRGSDRALADIAVDTGLGSQSRFTTTFRRATGFTPARWRSGRFDE